MKPVKQKEKTEQETPFTIDAEIVLKVKDFKKAPIDVTFSNPSIASWIPINDCVIEFPITSIMFS